MDENDLRNLSFSVLANLDEKEWRMWVYFQFKWIDNKLKWMVRILLALVGAVFGFKLV